MVVHKCSHCDKKFNQKSHLRDHLNKKKKCYVQENQQENINNHLNNQENEEEIKNQDPNSGKNLDDSECVYCHKFFSSKCNVIKHIRYNCKIYKHQKVKEEKEKMETYRKQGKVEEENKLLISQNNDLKKMNNLLNEKISDMETINKLLSEKVLELSVANKNDKKHEKLNCKVDELCCKIKKMDNNFNKNVKQKIIDEINIRSNEESEQIIYKSKNKIKKNKIPPKLRMMVWDKYIGKNIGKSECLCCETATISQMDFQCGHVVSEANGGDLHIDNMLPICPVCNNSMKTQDLFEFKNTFEDFTKPKISKQNIKSK